MKKIYILDTNVLLHDPNSLSQFADNDVIIPMVVIEELDNFKTSADERGKNARLVSRKLDELRQIGKLGKGVKLDNGGTLKVEFPRENMLPAGFSFNKADNDILNTAYFYYKQQENKTGKKPVIIISKDTNLRIKAEAINVDAQDYTTDKVNYNELYTGVKDAEFTSAQIDEFYKNKQLDIKAGLYYPNQFIILKSDDGSKKSAVGRLNQTTDTIKALPASEPSVWGIKPLNKEQRFAMELLLDDNVDLVTLVGTAGTGKTLITLATGLHRTFDDETYRRLLVCRPIVPVGRDLGFLPGTMEEKLEAWMGAIHDNLSFLANKKNPEDTEEEVRYLMTSGKLEIASVTHIRGRTLPKQYMIVDDAQNLTPHEIKTILSRAGDGTKVVVTGDPYQIDTPYLDTESNGLTYLVERFKGQKTYGHITFTKTERSSLADLASRLL
ncbi:MAG: PhoH family protein [Elusimicrobiota bacterium]|jgi:PhoH-like ATPase|nr:PhoH family protein [Elusimicrobiota bacterium]